MPIIHPVFIQVCTINDALVMYRGNQTKLAEDLAINRGTLRGYINKGGEHLLKVITDAGQVSSLELINKGIKS